MINIRNASYEGYNISITEEAGRFTPRVMRQGALVVHGGRRCDVWTGATYASFDRALEVARSAIDVRWVQ